jgi:uncharacterized OB-fold protein
MTKPAASVSTEPFEIATRILNEYRYSYGGISPFFRALAEEKKLTGTRCPKCATVFCPPRTRCGNCYVHTEWVELPDTATVVSAIDCYYVPENYELHDYLDLPYTLALVRVDGADTCLHTAVHYDGPHVRGKVRPGARVTAMFRERREGRLTDVYFRLEKEA